MNNTPENPKSPFRAPSARVTAALAAAMLAIGVVVGAAIGPAPSPSLANSSLPVLLSSLARIAATRAAQSTTAAVQPPPVTPEATPTRKKRSRAGKSASTQETPSTTTPSTPEATTPASTTPTSTGKAKTTTLPPITHVWLIELAGTSFAAATAQPTAAPYIDTQAIPAGTLLSGWSALDGGAFATETALLATGGAGGGQITDTIVQPACPEGAAGASCATEAGALSAADEFLKATVPTITSTAAFRESGLIVVTFASVGSATATGLPAGAATATLTSQPPAGVLLISPFAHAGAHPATAFNPTSPKQSLSGLLH